MSQNLIKYLLFFTIIAMFSTCQKSEKVVKETPIDTRTPVTITNINQGEMQDFLELNATSTFLQKSFVKATSNGYLQSVSIKLGEYVGVNKVLFTLKTKETQSLGNVLNGLDSTFKFSGITKIPATQSGYITQLNHQNGDYVQDGEQLAVISEIKSFVFLLDLPYELRPYILNQKSVKLTLPDGKIGLGVQYQTPVGINYLLDLGYIKIIK
jgi:multidrug efflux pump subunit AcrA (membrane-fusion protein)